jgi:23S rRNA (uracil1939-C5)-methyltransferase
MTEPKCPYFGKCGGCSSQHISYETQLEGKQNRLKHILQYEDVKVFGEEPYNYRNRMDFIFSRNGLGFRKKGDWKKQVAIDSCAISEPRINGLFKQVDDYFKDCDYFDILKQTGTFRYAVIRTATKGASISFVLNLDSTKLEEASEKIKKFANQSDIENVLVTYVPQKTDMSTSEEFYVVKGSDMLEQTYCGNTFKYSAQGFFQNNHNMAEKMHQYVTKLLEKYNTSNAHLLDVYAGVGTFGINNAHLFKSVISAESYAGCIDAAKENIKLNNKDNCEALVMDAKNLNKLNLKKPLYIITDPPRSGMHRKTIEEFNTLQPDVIIYISCHIDQLGKDLPKLKGYVLKSAAVFDLFPHTPHCEGIVELVRE